MITDMNSRVAMAQKLSIPQLQQAIKNGTIPAYVGVPLLQDKMRQQQQMQMAAQQQQGIAAERPPIAEEIMAQAGAMGGVDQLPSNLPITDDEEDYAGGGIVAFSGKDGSTVKFNEENSDPLLERLRQDDPNAFQRLMRSFFPGFDPRDKSSTDSSTVFTPSVKDVPFTTGPQTTGGAVLPYRRQRGASNAPTPDLSTRDEELLPTQDLSLLDSSAPDTETTSPTRGSLTEGLTPASIKASEDQLPKAIAALPSAANAPRAGTPPAPAGIPTVAPHAATPAAETAAAPVSALDKYAEMLMKEREGIAKDRQAAKAMALVQAGLGVAGGTSPNPFANLAQGIIPATQAYQAEMKGIRKEDADRLKHLMSMGVSKEKLALEARKLGITEKHYDQIFQAAMARNNADKSEALEVRRLNLARGLFGDFLKANPFADEATQKQGWQLALQRAGMGPSPSADVGTSGVMGSYVPGKGYIPNK